MGLFDSIRAFTSAPEVSDIWIQPESKSDLSGIFSADAGTYLVYKHSFRCGTCIFTLRNLEKQLADLANHSQPVFIDVVKQRELSNYIADKSGVKHESPQAILFHKGEVVWHGSHSGVWVSAIEEALQNIRD